MTLGLALALLFTLGWVSLFFVRAESVHEALPSYGWGERLSVLAAVVALTVHVSACCVVLSFAGAIAVWRGLSSVAVFAAGIGLWLWGRMMIGPLRVPRMPDEPPLRFQRGGAFGIVRHPLYLGYLLAAGAPLLAAFEVALAVTYASCAIALAVRARQEERRLHAQLGDAYAAYCREVKRLIPFVW